MALLLLPKCLCNFLEIEIGLECLRLSAQSQQLKRLALFGNGITVVGRELQDLPKLAKRGMIFAPTLDAIRLTPRW